MTSLAQDCLIVSSGDVPDEVQFRSDEGVKRNAYPLNNLGYVGQIANLLYALFGCVSFSSNSRYG